MAGERLALLYSQDEISKITERIAHQISQECKGKDVILVCILKGAFIFMADLVRNLSIPVKIDFVRLASYGAKSHSSRNVTITMDTGLSIKGKDVIIVEDILDSGLTLSFLMNRLMNEKPESLRLCVLIDKKERREVDIQPDYVGFVLEKGFVVGYGLDFNEKYRYLPEIYRIESDC
ncbi:MAG: hypoxanthine phosphoribosyltransferase [Thermodesulfobacteriota bacterium]|nr:hypoxanthine phosphoribosyltransferase [Thermodesulfobacteriota bacterium]